MQKMKRFLAFVMCLVTMFSSVNFSTVFAEEGDEAATLENIALNKTVYTNPSYDNRQLIVDGSTKYRYVTDGKPAFLDILFGTDMTNGSDVAQNEAGYNYKDDAYIIVDLGATYLLDSFTIYDFEREAGYIRDYIYDISVSNDADFNIDTQESAEWISVAKKEAGTFQCVNDYELSEKVAARYVKLHNLKALGAYSFAMTELEAYGVAMDDIETMKTYAFAELAAYRQDLELNETEAANKAAVVNAYTNEIGTLTTANDILDKLNSGMREIDAAVSFSVYKAEKKIEISEYKSRDGLFLEEDTVRQAIELEKTLDKISEAETIEAIDEIAEAYKNVIDKFVVNLALGKTATADSQQANSVRAALAVDGDYTSTSSRWGSAKNSDPHWIYVDLGEEMEVGTVIVYWEMRKPTSYSIQISNDSSVWETVEAFETRPYALKEYITFSEVKSARYVRLYIESFTAEDPDGGVTYNTVSIFELQVYSEKIYDSQKNLAQGKTATADSQEADSVRAELAVDGDTTSRESR